MTFFDLEASQIENFERWKSEHDDEVRAELIEELCNRHLDDNSWCEYTVNAIVDELEEIARKLSNNLER